MRANGADNLGILQGFVPNIRSTGQASLQATLDGPMRTPLVSGTMTIEEGRIRHFDQPHALENISGVVRFDSRGVTLDEVTAQFGGGAVQFAAVSASMVSRPPRRHDERAEHAAAVLGRNALGGRRHAEPARHDRCFDAVRLAIVRNAV
jgi:hypothetical protein